MKKINERILKELDDSPARCAVIDLVNGSKEKIAKLVNDYMLDYYSFDETNISGDREADILDNEIITAAHFMENWNK